MSDLIGFWTGVPPPTHHVLADERGHVVSDDATADPTVVTVRRRASTRR